MVYIPSGQRNERIYEDSAQRYKGLIYPVTAFGDWYGSFIIVFDKKKLEKSEDRKSVV